MKESIFEDYKPPLVEIIEVQVEYGFTSSGNNGGMNLPSWEVI